VQQGEGAESEGRGIFGSVHSLRLSGAGYERSTKHISDHQRITLTYERAIANLIEAINGQTFRMTMIS
jgi:hypothetical protein